ncbi:FecR family protein [Mucilaginibacter sp. SP1R1]|uniref:FecR family protein n=1 Tax=Mucilaginibacter sp. SP1R1 TaxID=2723091 RepID=UPI0016126BEA|nr:FecR family protein [Mucilaginibacter sp. SP1R1]MBB6148128.1 ferric-dicitrate binding protein FerR (iron transport regulator) [Mucilaginibacter sp. SP1R1]
MTREQAQDLLNKNKLGKCTAEEQALLDRWYFHEAAKQETADGPQDILAEEQLIWNRILQEIPDNNNIRHFKKWHSIAAAIILFCLSSGAYFLLKKPATDNLTAKNQPVKNDIGPGGNKAILTLANGSQIVLDDAKNGNIANNAAIKVNKIGNGMLVYHFNKTASDKNTTASSEINTITTPRGGQYQIELEDGTKIWLNAASSIKFPQVFADKNRQVELNGEAYFEVAKNKAKPFIVKANGTLIQVFGTHFNVNAYMDNSSIAATLLEGSVSMTYAGTTVMLKPGQQGVTSQNKVPIKTNFVDTEEITAWKNGLFIFHDQSIANIMKQVSRWYDVDVEYKDGVQNKEFGGTISKYKNITELLNNIQFTQTIHYKLEGRRVIIMK